MNVASFSISERFTVKFELIFVLTLDKSSRPDVLCEKGVLRNFAKFTGKHLCQNLFFNKVAGGACNFIKKETLTQVFSCEFCDISKNTFFNRTPLVAASDWKMLGSSHRFF